jgi:hypothetical protein
MSGNVGHGAILAFVIGQTDRHRKCQMVVLFGAAVAYRVDFRKAGLENTNCVDFAEPD